jgi:tetratricopeptide (TPR) repeat protein
MVTNLGRPDWSAVLSMAPKKQFEVARKLLAASGYLELEMPAHALRTLGGISDPEVMPFQFYQLLGLTLRAESKFEEALVALSRAHKERPDDLDVLMAMAWCYKRTDRLPQAISVMQEAYLAHPKIPVVLYNIACYYSLAGGKAQALSWLGRALRMETALRKQMTEEPEFERKSLRELIPDEPDFDQLRNDPDFQYIANLELTTDL